MFSQECNKNPWLKSLLSIQQLDITLARDPINLLIVMQYLNEILRWQQTSLHTLCRILEYRDGCKHQLWWLDYKSYRFTYIYFEDINLVHKKVTSSSNELSSFVVVHSPLIHLSQSHSAFCRLVATTSGHSAEVPLVAEFEFQIFNRFKIFY